MNTQGNKAWRSLFIFAFMQLFFALFVNAQGTTPGSGYDGFFVFLLLFLVTVMGIVISMSVKTKQMIKENKKRKATGKEDGLSNYLQNLDSQQIEIVLKGKRKTSKD
jgi:hypothetical protein